MPEVTFSPINQCTLEDPTDGAQPSSVAVAARTAVARTSWRFGIVRRAR